MIKGIIKNYNDAKFYLIQKMSESKDSIFLETEFLDDATINCKINRLKDEFKSISKDIQIFTKYDKKDSYNVEKLSDLMNKKRDICFNIAFLASNSLNNLDSCENILSDLDTDFKDCITALKYYKAGDNQKAFEIFCTYFKDKNWITNHYLINKVYGLMLYECKQYKTAILLLRKVVEKRPEDIEIHKILREIYSIVGMKEEERVEKNILNILEA